jgi:hypothetical protein
VFALPTIFSITQSKDQGIVRRILANLYRGKPKLTRQSFQRGEIRYLTYEKRKKSVPWERISQMAGEDRGCLICNREITVPDCFGLRRFEPNRFGGCMACNALFSVLITAKIPPGALRIALYDPCARYMDTAKALMPYCSQLRVLTEDLIQYRKAAEEIMERCGGVLLLSNRPRDIQDSHVLLSPGRWTIPVSGMDKSILFAGVAPGAPFQGIAFWEYHVPLPEEYRQYCPISLENFTYLAALYELCHIEPLERLIPDGCICGREVYSLIRLASLLQKAVK